MLPGYSRAAFFLLAKTKKKNLKCLICHVPTGLYFNGGAFKFLLIFSPPEADCPVDYLRSK